MNNEIVTAIGSLGFPIVACIAMYKLTTTTLENLTKNIQENTLVLKELSTRLSPKKED